MRGRWGGLRGWWSGGRWRYGWYPDPLVGGRHAVTLEVVAAFDVADVPLNRRGFLIDGPVGRIRIWIGIVVGVGIERVRERRRHEDPAEEARCETAAVVVEPVVRSSMKSAAA